MLCCSGRSGGTQWTGATTLRSVAGICMPSSSVLSTSTALSTLSSTASATLASGRSAEGSSTSWHRSYGVIVGFVLTSKPRFAKVAFSQAFNLTIMRYCTDSWNVRWVQSNFRIQMDVICPIKLQLVFLSSVNVLLWLSFECFIQNPPVFHTLCAVACGPFFMAITHRAFCAEHYLWHLDWLKMLGRFAARNHSLSA